MRVVPGLRSIEGAFEEALITNAVVAAKAIDQAFLYREYFIQRQELDRVNGQGGGPALRCPEQSLRGGPSRLDAIDACVRSR